MLEFKTYVQNGQPVKIVEITTLGKLIKEPMSKIKSDSFCKDINLGLFVGNNFKTFTLLLICFSLTTQFIQ